MGPHKNENGIRRCLLAVDGLAGYVVAIAGLVLTLAYLAFWAIEVQNDNSEVYYSVNQDIHAVKTQSINNNTFRIQE